MRGARWWVLAAALALAGCGAQTNHTAANHTTTTEAGSATTAAAPAGSGASSTTTSTSAHGTGSSTVAPATGSAAPSRSSGSAPAGPAPIAAGTYRYRQSGSFTAGTQTGQLPAEGTFVVDPAKPDGTQVTHRYVDPSKPPSDTTLLFRPDGMFIVTTVDRSTTGGQTVSFTCTFNPPLPSPPWPAKVGSTFAGNGNCGSFTAQVNGRVDGTRQVTLDGASVLTYVIDSTIVTHGSLESTINEQDWFDPAIRFSTHVQTQTKGSYGPFQFSGQSTADLESARPS
ncbi:MAG TPA: hypothetical protein VFA11_18260 [Acidimicrobiales bacterium]|nr:hypothetical protein [Acidimicrobiales bacterium]